MSSISQTTRYRDVFASAGFRVVFGMHTLLVLGDSVKTLGLSVLVYDRTDSSLAAAVAFMAGMLPYAVGGALLLSLADRTRPRTLLVSFHALRFAVTGVLALGAVPIPAAIALVALTGLFAPLGTAASSGLLTDLLDGDRYVLGRSLFVMTSGGAQIAGQAVGGVLLLTVGPYGALWLASASCLLTAVTARLGLRDHPPRTERSAGPDRVSTDGVRPDGVRPDGVSTDGVRPDGVSTDGVSTDGVSTDGVRSEPGRTGTATRSAVRETWRVNRRLLADPAVRGLLLAQWLPISLAVGAEGVVIPYAAAAGRPAAAGMVLAATAAGMLTGHFVMGRFASPPRRERLALPLALLPGTPLLVFAWTPGLVAASMLLATTALGFCYELGLQRRYLEIVPDSARGQALGLASTGIMTGQAAGVGIAGGAAELLAPGTVMALSGLASIVSALALRRHLRPGQDPGPRPSTRPR